MKKTKIVYTVLCVLLAVAGGFMTFVPNLSLTLLSTVTGVIFLAFAIAGIISYVVNALRSFSDSVKLVLSIFALIIGMLFVAHPSWLLNFVLKAVGVFIFVSGLNSLSTAVDMKRSSYGRWWISLCVALINLILGVVFVAHSFEIGTFAVRACGVALLVAGVSRAGLAIMSLAQDKKEEPKYIEYEEIDNNN
jgi:uncharacterized membrane protein HdeD (DUF308 family)